jgi:hypothetical protein
MAKRFVERDLRELYPNLDEMLVKLLNEGGQAYAAFQLGTTQPTISEIIKRSGKIRHVNHWELVEPEKEPG